VTSVAAGLDDAAVDLSAQVQLVSGG
jgi:hypothetical protein